MIKCNAGGHFVEEKEIILGKDSREDRVCLACVHRLKIPHIDPVTGIKVTFDKPSVLDGNTMNKRGKHLRQKERLERLNNLFRKA